MSTSRFFVTNLPIDTSEDELRTLFSDYGEVELVDIKSKENPLEPGNITVFAFVTLQIGPDDAQYCLNSLKWQKLRGANIKVSLAKESFLERLKRERNETETVESPPQQETQNKPRNDLLSQNFENTRKVFNEDFEYNEDDVDSGLLITKKRAARSMQNGKIIIEESGLKPIHVIEKAKKKNIQTAAKTTPAEQKRKESQNKMKTQYEQKKNTIQEALSNLNDSQKNKIKFSDSDEDEVDIPTKSKKNIFDSENPEEEEENINLLKVNYSKKGEKLAKLQSQNQNLDPRFNINEKFVDDEECDGVENEQNEENENEDERKWQLNILEQVVGHKIDSETAIQKAAKNKQMLKFDPLKASHQKMLRQETLEANETQTSHKNKKVKQSPATETQEIVENPVSKDVFYIVSDTLTDTLKSRGEGFSLLNMFGHQTASTEFEQREDQLKQLKDEKILVNKMHRNGVDPLDYESSSSGEDDDYPSKTTDKENKTEENNKKQKNSSKKAKGAILMETFFFTPKDERFSEGAKFFSFDKAEQIANEDYEPVRRKLNMLIKKKIVRTQKNLPGAGRNAKRGKRKI